MRLLVLAFGIFIYGAIAANVFAANQEPATVHYYVWFNSTPSSNGEQKLAVPTTVNTSFFDVMLKAQDMHEDYDFEYITYPFGRYITAINGVFEDPANHTYWMIYDMNQTHPDVGTPPGDEYLSNVGVDGIFVEHNDVYLFWRRVYEINNIS